MLKPAVLLLLLMNTTLADSPPNVLFIAIDDLRDVAGYFPEAHPDARTPNIDRLSARGISFTNAYCQAPMCAPSRNSLMTGLLPSSTGCYGFQPRRDIPAMDVATLPEHFRNNGYTTIGTGKIHHGSAPSGHGPDPEEWDEYWPSIERPRDKSMGTYATHYQPWGNLEWGATVEGEEAQGDYKHAEWATRRIDQGITQPFFLGVGFYRPHLPWAVPSAFFDDFSPADALSPIPRKEDDLDDVPEAGEFFAHYISAGRVADDYTISRLGWNNEALQAYLASVEFTDRQVGKVLDALARSPYADNTIVVLWGDHGFQLGEKKTWKKFTLWRESDRVPLIIVVPDKLAGKTCNAPVQLLDIYPTLVALAGLPQPDHTLEGHDLSPLLENPTADWPYAALTTAGENNHAVSTERWRYIRYFDGGEELYDIQQDPHEWTNLANDPAYAEIKTILAADFPAYNAPNAPGSTFADFYDRGNWDMAATKAESMRTFEAEFEKAQQAGYSPIKKEQPASTKATN